MIALVVLVAVFLGLAGAFVWFYLYSRTPAWAQSETRKALLSTMVLIGPLFGMHYRREPPEPPAISTPGPNPAAAPGGIIPQISSEEGDTK